jgi:ABC-2 type transport system ATP-binding protein
MHVELDDDASALGARLVAAGMAVRTDGRSAFVELVDTAGYDAIRDAAAELEVGLVRIEPERRSLEDLFLDDAQPGPVA